MLSKQTPNRKRASAPKNSSTAKQFIKDWERLAHSGRHDLNAAKEGMLLLIANDGPLPAEWQDHPLVGGWKGYREFHAKGDLLVIYKAEETAITFVRIGTHSELF